MPLIKLTSIWIEHPVTALQLDVPIYLFCARCTCIYVPPIAYQFLLPNVVDGMRANLPLLTDPSIVGSAVPSNSVRSDK